MFHAIHRTFGTHKVAPQEKTVNTDFDKLYLEYKTIEKDIKSFQAAAQGVSAGWKRIHSSNIEFVEAYENVFQSRDANKKGKKETKKQQKKVVVAQSLDQGQEPEMKTDLTGHVAATPAPIFNSDDYILTRSTEQYNITTNNPKQKIKAWQELTADYIETNGKLPLCREEIKTFKEFLYNVNNQIAKRNEYVKDLDYYTAKLRDAQLVKNPDAPKKKSNIYKNEAKVKALQETYEEAERVCVTNMNKALHLRYELALRATAAFLTTQALIFSQQPFTEITDKFLERHEKLKPERDWDVVDFTFAAQAHKVKNNKKNKAVAGVSIDRMSNDGEKEKGKTASQETIEEEKIPDEVKEPKNEKEQEQDEGVDIPLD